MTRVYIKRSLLWCQELAAKRDGLCLSTEYVNPHMPMLWQCNVGHQWTANAWRIYNDNWCGACSNVIRKDLSHLRALALSKGGTCLSTEYTNNKAKYRWRCASGHEWEASGNMVQKGTWCPICAGGLPHDLDWLQEVARLSGGRCLSVVYEGVAHKYEWQCGKGHRWLATAHDVSQGSWCPGCFRIKSRQETEVYDFICALLPGIEVRGRDRFALDGLELDVYIPSRLIAVEYCGLHWHGELQSGSHTRHLAKLRCCDKMGIRLITVFADEWLMARKAVEGYLRSIFNSGIDFIFGARKCSIKPVDFIKAANFIELNHVQGCGLRGNVSYAIYHNDNMLAVAVFRKSTSKGRGAPEEGCWELTRYCVGAGFRVQGGLGKILSVFKTEYNPEKIITFADKRWSHGDLYRATGFVLEGVLPPSYWYFKKGTSGPRFHKSGFRKPILLSRYGGDPQLSEWKLAQAAGFDRIWDCGLERWVWYNSKGQSLTHV